MEQSLTKIADYIRVPILIQITPAPNLHGLPVHVMRSAQMEFGEAQTPQGAAKLQLILKHLEEQTGLDFHIEQRDTRVWSLVEAQ